MYLSEHEIFAATFQGKWPTIQSAPNILSCNVDVKSKIRCNTYGGYEVCGYRYI